MFVSQPGRLLLPGTFLCILMFAAPLPARAADDKPKLPEGPGKATTERLCGSCHGVGLVMNRRESRDGWSGVVVDMIQRGAKGTEEEFGEVVDYLVTHFPKTGAVKKVNVNQAPSKDLVAILGVTEEQATAIVQHRESKGQFKTLDDLAKVAGIDSAALESKKNRIEF